MNSFHKRILAHLLRTTRPRLVQMPYLKDELIPLKLHEIARGVAAGRLTR
jgi:hypothetical protein